MKRIITSIFIFFSVISAIAQKYNLSPFQYFNYGKYLLKIEDNTISHTLNKNYFSVVVGKNKIFLSDSSVVYYIDKNNFSIQGQDTLMRQSADLLQLMYLKSNTEETIYAIGKNIFDTVKIYKIIDNNIADSIILGKYNGKEDIIYHDSSQLSLIISNIISLSGNVEYQFRFLSLNNDGITSDTTITYQNPQTSFSYPVQSLKISEDKKTICLISSANTYIFHLNEYMNFLGVEQYPIYGSQADLVKDNYLFLSDNKKLYRLDISKGSYSYRNFSNVIKSLTYLPNASLLISFFSNADTNFISVLNPDASNINSIFPQYTDYNFTPQSGARLNYKFISPWFDFVWQADNNEQGHYLLSLDSNYTRFEPDTIKWYVDQHLIAITTKGNNAIDYRIFRQGNYNIEAQGIYSQDSLTVKVNHILNNPYDVFPDIIPEDTIYFCTPPDTTLNITKYTTGSDSIVWFLNKKRYTPLFNQSLAHITLPGEYYLYIYLPDTILSDTVIAYYVDKEFSIDQLQLYIDNEPYDSTNNIYCTNDGNVYFEIKFPPNSKCEGNYLAYWNFGDGYITRKNQTYIDHKYYTPGKYTVILTLRNINTDAAYDFIIPIQVSINPIKKYPKEINLQKLSKKRIYLSKDIIVENQKIKEYNIFYNHYGHQIFDSAKITIPITDKHYQSASGQNITFFTFLASDIAEGTEIKLYNSHNQEATIMPNQLNEFPNTRFFYGHPKIDIPNYPHKNESFYHYYWNDESSLTFYYMTHTNPSTSGIFNIFNDYIEEMAWFDLPHYQTYPTTLEPYSSINDLALDTMGTQWKVKFIVHPRDTGINHTTVHSVGLILPSYLTNNQYTYKWDSDLPHTVYNDTILEISSQVEGKYYFSMKISDKFNCEYSIYTRVYVLDTLAGVLPNVFTPNDDGSNDIWDLRSAFYNEIFVENVPILVKIWDKNGRIITTFIANQTYGWDGRDSNGKKVPPGTYWYLITVANKIHLRGYISVIY